MPTPSAPIALTGATGFVGSHILARLIDQGQAVRVLVRDPARLKLSDPRIDAVPGDLFNPAALARLVAGTRAVIHVVGIIMEKPAQGQTFDRVHAQATARVLVAAKAAGVKRFIHMSALGSRPDAVSRYHQTKWQAEQSVRASGLDWTIFRPSIIHGPDGEFMQMVKGFWCHRFPPFVPYFSRHAGLRDIIQLKLAVLRMLTGMSIKGQAYVSRAPAGRLQPVYVEDVAACFAAAIDNPKSISETYPLGGPDVYTWPELFLACKKSLPHARNKIIAPVPVWYAKMIAGLPLVPFNHDQVIMSQEDSTCRIDKVQTDFNIKLAPFAPTLAQYAADI